MRELIWGGCHWEGHRRESRTYYFDNGIVAFESGVDDWGNNSDTLRWFKSLGYDSVLAADRVDRILARCVGKGKDAVEDVVLGYAKRLRDRRDHKKKTWDEWGELRDRFGGNVIGLEKEIDIYESGFSVRVLLSSSKTMDERRKFLRDNREDFVRYVMDEVGKNKRVMGRIGDIRFYKPAELIIMRVPVVEVKFEVKNVL